MHTGASAIGAALGLVTSTVMRSLPSRLMVSPAFVATFCISVCCAASGMADIAATAIAWIIFFMAWVCYFMSVERRVTFFVVRSSPWATWSVMSASETLSQWFIWMP